MNAKKCDRCGILYENYINNDNCSNAIRISYRKEDFTVVNNDFFDLCPKCMESFERWLKEGK